MTRTSRDSGRTEMAQAIEQLFGSGLTVGHAGLGLRGQPPQAGSAKQQVHDGDTVTVRPLGNLGVRFLGIDAAEASFQLPGGTAFVPIDDRQGRWEAFLSDPFAAALPPITPALRTYLQPRVGAGVAANHGTPQPRGQRLSKPSRDDRTELGKTKTTCEFFLAFANEIMAGYGRLLGYLN